MDEAGMEEATTIQQDDLEESKRRSDLAYLPTSNDDQALWKMMAKHVHYNTLIQINRLEEAVPLVDEVLEWVESSGKSVVTEELVMPWYSSRGHVLAEQGRDEEALAIYTRVLKRSGQILSIDDDDLWIAYLNVSTSLFQLRRFQELQQLVSRLMDSVPDKSLNGVRLQIASELYK